MRGGLGGRRRLRELHAVPGTQRSSLPSLPREGGGAMPSAVAFAEGETLRERGSPRCVIAPRKRLHRPRDGQGRLAEIQAAIAELPLAIVAPAPELVGG